MPRRADTSRRGRSRARMFVTWVNVTSRQRSLVRDSVAHQPARRAAAVSRRLRTAACSIEKAATT